MTLSDSLAKSIVSTANGYLGTPFCMKTFNCVHFVREVYCKVGLSLPLLARHQPPPCEFHLSPEKFEMMPAGHSVFFKRKGSLSSRHWTHVAIIVGSDTLVHCTRNIGDGVVATRVPEFLEVYDLASSA